MRIGVDLRVLASGRRTGVEEYTVGLLEELVPLASQHEWVFFYNAWRKPALTLKCLGLPWVRLVQHSLPNRPLMAASTYLGMPRLEWFTGVCDLFFSPHLFPAAVLARTPLVTTFHDLGFVHHPEFSSAKKYWWHRLARPHWQAQRSRRVITVSESSKHDLVALYGVPAEKIRVIHSGIGSEFKVLERTSSEAQAVRAKYRLPARFILYLGTIEPRKNITGLMRAFEALAERGYEGALVIAGIRGWSYRPILEAWRRSQFARRILFTGFVHPGDKPFVYNLAECFVYPSFFEGFGFPPLEAMACGTAVVTSRVSSLPEIAGDAALLVDPHNTSELARAIAEVLKDAQLRARLIERGIQRAGAFTWRRAALSTLQVFEEVV